MNREDETLEESRSFVYRVIDVYDAEEPTQGMIVNYSWQYEAFVVMLWALGFLETDDGAAWDFVSTDT